MFSNLKSIGDYDNGEQTVIRVARFPRHIHRPRVTGKIGRFKIFDVTFGNGYKLNFTRTARSGRVKFGNAESFLISQSKLATPPAVLLDLAFCVDS